MTLLGYGVVIGWQTAAGPPAVYNELGEIVDIGGPSVSRDSVERTHEKSPDAFREFMPGLKDGGEVTFTVASDPTDPTYDQATGLYSHFDDDEIYTWKITIPTSPASTWVFDGFLTGAEPSYPIDDRQTTDVTIKVTGRPVLS